MNKEKTMSKNLVTNAAMHTAAVSATSTTSACDISALFKRSPKAATNSASATVSATAPAWAHALLAQGDALVTLYNQYKAEIFDRSDDACWDLLERVYTYVQSIDSDSVNCKLKKKEFVSHIKVNGYPNASASDSTASLVVKYVFGQQAKQTLNSYANTLKRAADMKIPCDQLAAKLKASGGYAKFLETYFDANGNPVDKAPVDQDAADKKATADLRIKYVRRLFAAMGRNATNNVDCSYLVQDYVPVDDRKEDAKKADPDNAKYKAGNLVFFVATEGVQPDTYNLVHGFNASRQVEDALVAQIARLLPASDGLLQQVVEGMESTFDFSCEEGTPIEE